MIQADISKLRELKEEEKGHIYEDEKIQWQSLHFTAQSIKSIGVT